MLNKKSINDEIELVNTLKMITQAYEEISVMRMQRIRSSVLQTRNFLSKFAEVFYDVKISYQNQITALTKKKKNKRNIQNKQSLNKNGKSISVLLSANNKLYGDITGRVFHLFIQSVKEKDMEIMIIGKLGRELFHEQNIKKPYLYFEIPEAEVQMEDLKPLAYNLLRYEKINVFHGRFDNILNQSPMVSNISGDQPQDPAQPASDAGNQNLPKTSKFLFEPSLEKVLQFFETQIFTSLFKQTVHESHLAHFASRIRAMEEALGNIDKRIFNLEREGRNFRRLISNKKQIEVLTRSVLSLD